MKLLSRKSKTILLLAFSSHHYHHRCPNHNVFVHASSLPSNALNRWSALPRGGEAATAVRGQVRSTSSSRTLIDTNGGTGTSAGTRPKKRRKKKSSSSSSGNRQAPASSSKSRRHADSQQQLKQQQQQKQQQPSPTRKTTAPPSTATAAATTKPISSSKNDQIGANIESQNQSTTTITNIINGTPSYDQMPTLFTSEESIYDKYAACLAATESLRRVRDSKLEKKKFRTAVNVDADRSGWKSLLKGDSNSYSSSGANSGNINSNMGGKAHNEQNEKQQQQEEYKRSCAEYVLNSSKVIKALGLSVSQFNQLGREIQKNRGLKEKVIEQAYLYRMASTIKMDKIPLIQDPNSEKLLQSHKRRRVQMFVQSITEIEELRSEQITRLKKVLKIDKLPPNMNLCDPNVLPLLSPQVRSVIEAFPLQAEVIVKKYGLNSDEFNQMLEETRGNPIFRWRVQRFRKNQDGAGELKDFRGTSF